MDLYDSDDSDAVDEFTKAFMGQGESVPSRLKPDDSDGSDSDEESSGDFNGSTSGMKRTVKSSSDSSGSSDESSESDQEQTTSNANLLKSKSKQKQTKLKKQKISVKEHPNSSDESSDTSDHVIQNTPLSKHEQSSLQFKMTKSPKHIKLKNKQPKEMSGDKGTIKDSDREQSDDQSDQEPEEMEGSDDSDSQDSDDSDNDSDSSESAADDAEATSGKPDGTANVESDSASGEDGEEEPTSTLDDEYTKLRKELADLPFDELQQLKEKIGIKAYNQAMFGTGLTESGKKVFKRENKNRPMEMSSKKPVGRFREIVAVKKKVHRDPRFDDLSGEYKETYFRQAYSFLDDVKLREKQKLLKQAKKEKDPEKKQQIESLINKMTHQQRAELEKDKRMSREQQRKKKERGLISEGKRPFYLKDADKKKLELAEKFRELKKSGKVENYMAKKRKKTAGKDKKKLPFQSAS